MKDGDLTGFDFSGKINVVQSWTVTFDQEEEFNAALMQHIQDSQQQSQSIFEWTKPVEECRTAFADFEVTCTPNVGGEATTDRLIMITNQHPQETNNYAIANYGTMDTVFTVTLNTDCTEVRPLDARQATTVLNDPNTCTFIVTVISGRADLFYFQATVGAPVDFFQVVIA